MFIRYQFYKGYIDLADYEMLCKLKEDIMLDYDSDILDRELTKRLLKMIKEKEEKSIKIMSV